MKLFQSLLTALLVSLMAFSPALAQTVLSNQTLAQQTLTNENRQQPVSTNEKLPAASFCDENFSSTSFDFVQPSGTTLGDLLEYISEKYNFNFLPDAEVVDLPVRLNVRNVPWHIALRQQLSFLDLEPRCVSQNTISILKRAKSATLQDNLRKSQPLDTVFIKLRYLQPSVGGQVNIAGKTTGGAGGAFESLEDAIQKIIRGEGDNRGAVSRVPGKNELIITGTPDQIARIREIIRRADRPSYQVVVRALVYTANESKLRDIGSQLSAVLGGDYSNGVPNVIGGVQTIPPGTTGGTGTGSTTTVGVNPNGVGTLPQGLSTPNGNLAAASPNSIFGLSAIFGAAQFTYQLSLAQQKGAINIQNRPFTVVLDGNTANLDVGRQIPVLIQPVGGNNSSPGQLEILSASNILQLTPQVIENEKGDPVSVNVNIRLESNEVDSAIVSQGVPGVNRRSIQTRFVLNSEQTVVLGGFTTDAVNRTQTKTPGLGDIPFFGNLFKRNQSSEQRDRLYFAISVTIIPQDADLKTVPVPKDAVTDPVPAPNPQNPSPYEENIITKDKKKPEVNENQDKKDN